MPRKVRHHADTAERPIKQVDDIGPVMRSIGVFVLLIDLGIFVYEKVADKKIEWPDVVVHVVMFFSGVFLIRPEFVDRWIKGVAAKIPFLKYGKD